MAYPMQPSIARRPSATLGRQSVPLAELAVGVPARFHRASLPANDLALLAAMGLGSGSTLCVRRHGVACIVDVGSTRLAVGGSVARRILVKPLSDDKGSKG